MNARDPHAAAQVPEPNALAAQHTTAKHTAAVPWTHRISTRLTLLLLSVVAVLAVAMGILLWRAFAAVVRLRTGVDLEPGLEAGLEGLGGALDVGVIDQEAAAAILRSTLVNLAVVVAITLLAAAAFSRSLLAEPISRLTEATRALAAGDRGVRIRSHDESELGELARSFDSMADALQGAQDRLEARVASRTAELRALLELSNTVALTTELQPQLEAVLARLVDTVDVVAAEVLELEVDGRMSQAASLGSVPERQLHLHERDAAAQRPARELTTMASTAVVDDDVLALPLRARGEVVGVLNAYAPSGTGWDDERLDLAGGLAAQAAVAIENARLYERAKEQAADEERQHLARELHDSVSQAIYAVVLTSHAVRKRLGDDPEASKAALDSVIELAEGALAEMRALIFELRPEALAEVGLVGAVNRQLDGLELRHGLLTERDLRAEPEIAFSAKQVLLRVVQEALHNVAKHAHAKTVNVGLRQEDAHLLLEIRDDGVGFDVNGTFPGHLGLTSMHERVAALGGTLRITSEADVGTAVSLRLPLVDQAVES